MTCPAEGRSVPASNAITVDLPAPFGPISPVSVPGLMLKETLATACTPPKSRLSPTVCSTSPPGRGRYRRAPGVPAR